MKPGTMMILLLTAVLMGAAQERAPGVPVPAGQNKHEMNLAMSAMSPDKMAMGDHMARGDLDMGPHMQMTPLRPVRAGDAERARALVATARAALEKYKDYHAALDDGYQIFLPNLPQKHKHFTNYKYAFENEFHFNPEHPTALLYDVDGEGYKLTGLMYTAPKRLTAEELDQRIPLSIAQWHMHVNLCQPPPAKRGEMLGKHPRFGLAGAISTQPECEAAGGKFLPVIFNWMIHMYPYESNPEQVWSMAKQHSNMNDMDMD